MVLTDFECWAHSGNGITLNAVPFERRNRVDLFNPSALQACGILQNNNNNNVEEKTVSHISSNGYYGFQSNTGNDVRANIEGDGGISLMPTNPLCATGVNGMENGNVDEMMDVAEQHLNEACAYGEIKNSTHSNGNLPANLNVFHAANNADRRKRFFVEEEFHTANKFNAKRCRIDTDSSSSIPMDDSQINSAIINPVQLGSDFYNGKSQMSICTNGDVPNGQQTLQMATTQSNYKSNSDIKRINNNNNDISRCMLSHMI